MALIVRFVIFHPSFSLLHLPFFVTSLPCHSPSSSLPFLVTPLPRHSSSSSFPFPSPSFFLSFPFLSSSLPFLATSLPVTFSFPRHFPTSSLSSPLYLISPPNATKKQHITIEGQDPSLLDAYPAPFPRSSPRPRPHTRRGRRHERDRTESWNSYDESVFAGGDEFCVSCLFRCLRV